MNAFIKNYIISYLLYIFVILYKMYIYFIKEGFWGFGVSFIAYCLQERELVLDV